MAASSNSNPNRSTVGEEPTNSGAMLQLIFVAVVVGVLTFLFNYFQKKSSKTSETEDSLSEKETVASKTSSPKVDTKRTAAVKKPSKSSTATRLGVLKFEHADHVSTIKGHSSEITDISFSSNGKYLVSISSDDRSIMLWSTKEFGQEGNRNSIRGKIDLDNPVSVDFSPDCKALAISLELSNSVKVMKIGKKEGSNQVSLVEGIEFPKVLELDILNCSISPSGTFLMVADNKSSIYILDLKGEIYGKIDAKLGDTIRHCVVSPCGRFVAFCGYNPEMPLYEIDFSSTNIFRGINRVMVLKGHTSVITHFAFSLDAVSIATISRDKTWRVHSIDVRYKDQEEPRLLYSGDSGFTNSSDLKCLLSCNGKLIGIYSETEIKLKSIVTGETYVTYSEFGTGLRISKCLTDNSSKHLIACVGKHMVVLKIVYHMMATIEWLKVELEKPNSPTNKSRIQQQLKNEQEKLEAALQVEKQDSNEEK